MNSPSQPTSTLFFRRVFPFLAAWAVYFFFRNHSFIHAVLTAPQISWDDIVRNDVLPAAALFITIPIFAGTGRFALELFDSSRYWFLQRVALSFVLGTGTWSILMTALGFAGLLHAWLLEGLGGAVLIVSLWRFGPSFRSNCAMCWSAITAWEWTWSRAAWVGFLIWGLSNAWLQSLIPPGEQDTIAHHFAHIKLWAAQGHLSNLRWLEHSQFPLHSEMLYMAAQVLHIDTLAQGWHWSFSVFLVIGLFAFWSGRLGADACLLASAVMVTLPLVSQISPTGHNEMVWTCYLVLSVSVLAQTLEGNWAGIVLAGVLGGFAASCRYNGIFAVACFSLSAFLFSKRLLKTKAQVIVYFVVAFLVVSPWFIKNYLLFKNPVWPLLIHVMGVPGRAMHFEELHEWSCWRDPNPLLWFHFPLFRIYKPTIAPLASHYFFLPLFLLMLAVGQLGKVLFSVTLLALVFYYPSVMVFETNWWRFLLPFAVIGCLYFGWAYHQPVRAFFRRYQRSIRELAWLVFVPAFFIRFYDVPTVLAGIRTSPNESARDHYLASNSNNYALYERINHELPSTVRILLFNENRGYYLDRDYRWGDPEIQDMIDYPAIPDGAALYRRLKALGITHILVNGENITYSLSTGKSVFEPATLAKIKFVTSHDATPVMNQGAIVLYQLE